MRDLLDGFLGGEEVDMAGFGGTRATLRRVEVMVWWRARGFIGALMVGYLEELKTRRFLW